MTTDLARFGFGSLMPTLVQDVLMVASPYDCFILEEDGRFSDRMFKEYAELDLASPPHFEYVTSGKGAMERLRRKSFDLVLMTPHCADTAPERLATRIKRLWPDLPIVLLTYDRAAAMNYSRNREAMKQMHIFVWTGDPKLLVAIVKAIEDLKNAAHDTQKGQVRVILVVEDSPIDYSEFLPYMYREVLVQLRLLLPDRLNDRDRQNRMRARPKILLARTFEEASTFLKRFKNNLLGVISDVRFPRDRVTQERAGIAFVRRVHKIRPGTPILLQSFEPQHRQEARKLNLLFADKSSKEFLKTISEFMRDHFGFGDFVFRLPDGREVDRARNMDEMVAKLPEVPLESILFHASRHQISNWLFARGEFVLALKLQPVVVDEFPDLVSLREFLVETFTRFIETRQRGKISDFTMKTNLLARDFTRIGSGSMGGKARGSAFLSHLLAGHPIHEKFPDIRIIVPRAAVICTDQFELWIDRHRLAEKAALAENDEEIAQLFLERSLDNELHKILSQIVEEVPYPLAVRSSSLLEDSSFQPLAGLYRTFMLPNCSASSRIRLEQLSRAVRLVVASSFFKRARKYLESHNLRPEQEKMAVLIQRLVGHRYNHRFYPDFAGVAQSYNYYPVGHMRPEDGIANMAMGFGRTVVEGRKSFRVCLRHPQSQPHYSSPASALQASQQSFFALDLSDTDRYPDMDANGNLLLLDLEEAKKDGVLTALGATWSPENDMIYDTIYREGVHLINFAGILKYDRFPVTQMLLDLMEICEKGMGCPVEIEFAVALDRDDTPAEMALLELRPLIAMGFEREVNAEEMGGYQHRLVGGIALGNGRLSNIRDVVYVHPDRFNFANSVQAAAEIEKINHRLGSQFRPYLLMGPGRWGSADPWLGIPVSWNQVSGSRVIVELQMTRKHIDPSQGTHFFHNLISLRVGYFCINMGRHEHHVDLDWLDRQPVVDEKEGVRHVILEESLEVRIDGRNGRGVILHGKKNSQESENSPS